MSKPELKIFPDGTKEWRLNGKLHRENGPARILSDDGELWYLNGELHREDGPAITWPDGTKQWYLNDKLHREDGPAIIYPNNSKSWYLNDRYLYFSEYTSWFIKKISNPSYQLTDGDVSFIKEYLE